MLSTSATAHSRWVACFSLAVFQTLVGIAVGSLAVSHMILANLVQGGPTPHVDACHDSTVAAVLQGITLVVAGALGISAYAPFLAPPSQPLAGAAAPGGALDSNQPGRRKQQQQQLHYQQWKHQQPRLVLVASHVLFSAVVAFVGYNAAASHGCFALGKGGEKAIFGIVVARVVLSYLCHIVGGLCAGLAMPDLCRMALKSRHHHSQHDDISTTSGRSSVLQRVIVGERTSWQTDAPRRDKQQQQQQQSQGLPTTFSLRPNTGSDDKLQEQAEDMQKLTMLGRAFVDIPVSSSAATPATDAFTTELHDHGRLREKTRLVDDS